MMDGDVERSTQATAHTPLLSSDRLLITSLARGSNYIGQHVLNVPEEVSWISRTRRRLQRFLTSKWGHYSVIILVSVDVAGIFADFLISLHICEHTGEEGFHIKRWEDADRALEIVSLVFSCLFMLELLACIWAFGFS